jgi:hypothetical protein
MRAMVAFKGSFDSDQYEMSSSSSNGSFAATSLNPSSEMS